MASLKPNEGGLINMITMSFGYAIQVSPLHTLTLYNAVANDGKMMKPYLVNRIQKDGLIIKQFEPTLLTDKIGRPETIRAAKECMEMVVTDGTGKFAFKDMPFAVAGKTGTAHVADGNIKYADGVYQASFVGYFPADKPQYTCIVVIRSKPHALLHFGGQLSAPVFRDIATRLYAMYVEKKNPSLFAAIKDSSAYFYSGYTMDLKNIYKTFNMSYTDSMQQNNLPSEQEAWSNVYACNYQPVLKANLIKPQVMPNVKGMGLKDALYLLENMGVKVTVNGKGKIITQSIAPGATLVKGIIVKLELS
jgi:cell division protein FtsI (penicillin-binding protein 3)